MTQIWTNKEVFIRSVSQTRMSQSALSRLPDTNCIWGCRVNGFCQDNHSANWVHPAGKGTCLLLLIISFDYLSVNNTGTKRVQNHDKVSAKSHPCLNNKQFKPTLRRPTKTYLWLQGKRESF